MLAFMGDQKVPAIEKHWRVKEVATQLGLSITTVIRMFEDHPDVRILGNQTTTKHKQKYRTLLIPDSALQQYLKALSVGPVIKRAG